MIPSGFSGRRALVVHRIDRHREALEAQLRRFGMTVQCLAPGEPLRPAIAAADVIFFDADTGHDNLFPWGRQPPPVPLIAILGSEAPGRLEWALAQSATAFISKPIGSSGAFQALTIAAHLHDRFRTLRASVDELSERLRARPLVVRAVIEIMRRHQLDETGALDRLRRGAMASRQTMEELAAAIAAAPALAARLDGSDARLTMVARPDRRTDQRSRTP